MVVKDDPDKDNFANGGTETAVDALTSDGVLDPPSKKAGASAVVEDDEATLPNPNDGSDKHSVSKGDAGMAAKEDAAGALKSGDVIDAFKKVDGTVDEGEQEENAEVSTSKRGNVATAEDDDAVSLKRGNDTVHGGVPAPT